MLTQIVVPFHNVPFKILWANREKIKKYGWHVYVVLFRKWTIRVRIPLWMSLIFDVAGFRNPFGVRRRVAYVKINTDKNNEISEYDFDMVAIADGPTSDFWGHATPSVMVVVSGEGEDGTYIRSIKESRPMIVNPHTMEAGNETEESIPGAWAQGGESSIEAAKRAMEKSGFTFAKGVEPQVVGHQCANRQWVETAFPTVSMPYVGEQSILVLDDDVIMRGGAHRIDEFPATKDSLVKASLWDFSCANGHISPKPVQVYLDRIAELEKELDCLKGDKKK